MDLVGQALVLAALGLPVFPCGQDKHPHAKNWPDAATRDPGVIMRWFKPGELIGIVCGPRSGLAVLDVDVPKHPEAGLWLDAHRARLPGRVFQTRSGGSHLYFRWVPRVKCITGRPGRPCVGIDVRGEGGYVIWWGGLDLGRASPQGLAEWPEWLGRAIWPPKPEKPAPAARRWHDGDPLVPLMARLESAQEGSRNEELFKVSCCAARDVKRGLVGERDARGELTASALYIGLRQPEIEKTIHQAFKSEGL